MQLYTHGPERRVTLLVGHDGNIANLAGMLDLHWTLGGYPTDELPPGGALCFETLRDAGGKRYVRAFFRVQSMEQLRDLAVLDPAHPAAVTYLRLPCGLASDRTICTVGDFQRMVRRASPGQVMADGKP